MKVDDAVFEAKARGWNPWRWLYYVERGTPEIHHPLDFLTEDEVESIDFVNSMSLLNTVKYMYEVESVY